jgi:hypothetical protein
MTRINVENPLVSIVRLMASKIRRNKTVYTERRVSEQGVIFERKVVQYGPGVEHPKGFVYDYGWTIFGRVKPARLPQWKARHFEDGWSFGSLTVDGLNVSTIKL